MADTYVQFSEELRVTKRDIKFIKERIEYFEYPPGEDEGAEWDGFFAACEAYEVQDTDHSALEFEVEYNDKSVIFYADESGNPYHVAKLVQDLFRKYHHDACFTIEWAVSSNRARPGSFSGGAMFVTAEKIEAFSTYQWLQKKTKAWDKKRGQVA